MNIVPTINMHKNNIKTLMHYLIYKTTNTINGKIYIGCHKTRNISDGYVGSGKILKRAINKYGIENFNSVILFNFDTSEEMFAKEKELVNESFISRKDTYNIKLGGLGGFDYINENNLNSSRHILTDKEKEKGRINARKRVKWLAANDKEFKKMRSNIAKNNKHFHCRSAGTRPSIETRNKIGIANKGKCVGEKNSQYGTCWIYSLAEKINKKIQIVELNSYVNNGWIKGRKMKF